MLDKVLMLDYKGQGKLWIWGFKKVSVSPPVLLSYVIGANYNGDIYCMANFQVSDNTKLKLSGGTYNLTEAL